MIKIKKINSIIKRFYFLIIILSIFFYLVINFISIFTHNKDREVDNFNNIKNYPVKKIEKTQRKILKLISLNLAHGRKKKINQILVSKKQLLKNLKDISLVLEKHETDIVALQEVDFKSVWNHDVDLVYSLAKLGGFPFYARSKHVRNGDPLNLNYGTGILSRYKIVKSFGYTFEKSPPTFSKGFTASKIKLGNLKNSSSSNKDNNFITVLSIHLDFSRNSVRIKQASEIINFLKKNNEDNVSTLKDPLILLGDFNSGFLKNKKDDSNNVIELLMRELNLKTFKPHLNEPITFSRLGIGLRLDWILFSNHFRLLNYEVLPDILSDHFGISMTLEKIK